MQALRDLASSTLVFWTISGCLTAMTVALLVRSLRPAQGLATRRLAIGITVAVPAAALGLYTAVGQPDLTAWRTRPAMPPFIAAVVGKLEADAAQHPADEQAWVLLGDVYRKVQRYRQAADCYRHASALVPGDARLKAALGEMLVQENGGAVDAEALALFDEARPEPEARYYLALAKSQAGDWPGALADWQALLAQGPPDAPWIAQTNARIGEARQATGQEQDR